MHGDHVFGLFGLLSTFSMLGRKNALNIYGNPKLEDLLNMHFQFFETTFEYPLIFHSFGAKKTQTIYHDDKLEVSTIPLKHRVPCVGFLFREKTRQRNIKKEFIEQYKLSIKDIVNIKNGADFETADGLTILNKQLTIEPVPPKSYAYCSDTKALKSILPAIRKVDLLYHEATFMDIDAKLAKITYHSTAAQAAELAKEANVKKLLIGHFSSRYKNDANFLTEAQNIFPNTIMAEDGLDVEI